MLEALLEEFVDFRKFSWPESPREQVVQVLQFLLDGSLTPRRKQQQEKAETVDLKNLAWVFTAGANFQPIPVRTFETLEKLIDAGAVYFTPNTFYSRKAKTRDALRWLNCLYVDIDDPAMTDLDVLDRCRETGLPQPSLINKTPRGLHCYWKIRRVRATEKALKLYSKLLRTLAEAFGADVKAATAEHFLRIPTTILSFERVEYELSIFKEWLSENVGIEGDAAGVIMTRNILHHPAVQKLLEGVEIGKRNNTAFTLALCYRVTGCGRDEALRELLAWNQRNRPPLRTSEAAAAVRSAYNGRYHGPSARWIERLSGIPFRHWVIKARKTGGRPGRPRLQETVREKFVALIQDGGGSLITRENRKKIAVRLRVSERTLNTVIAQLSAEGLLTTSTRRLGRGNGTETSYIITAAAKAAPAQNYNTAKSSEGGEHRLNRAERRKAHKDAKERYENLGTRKKARLRRIENWQEYLLNNALECCNLFVEITPGNGPALLCEAVAGVPPGLRA
ncbi:MAG: primase C-terminal domain-containing protein [Bacillota bacterium]